MPTAQVRTISPTPSMIARRKSQYSGSPPIAAFLATKPPTKLPKTLPTCKATIVQPHTEARVAAIRRIIKDKPPRRKEHRDTYSAINRQREFEIDNHRDQVDLARIRSGYHPHLKSYQHIIDENMTRPVLDATTGRTRSLTG